MQTLAAYIRGLLFEARPKALNERVAGTWQATSTSQLQERVDNLAVALREIAGLQPGERVALIAENSIDWLAADYAVLTAGLVVVPIFATQAFDQVAYILEHSGAKLIFAGSLSLAERLRREIPACPRVICFHTDAPDALREFESQGQARRRVGRIDVTEYTAGAEPNAMSVLIYTSGTTGSPKGVMLSHTNIISNVEASYGEGISGIAGGENVLSILPFSHIYEHHVVYVYLRSKVNVYICHSPEELLADLRDVHPVFMTAVPRIFERVLANIVANAKSEGGLKAKLVPWALRAGRDYMRVVDKGGGTPGVALRTRFALAHTLVLRKLRPLLGLDRLKFFGSGSAPLHLDIAYTLAAADIKIIEGYGPTECAPVLTANRHATNRYGTVGKPLPNLELRIADDGEICARGPNVMLGYYNDPDATAAAIVDGWYHTGDIGQFDKDGYLRITDRKKEIFKTSTGKFIAPSRVEASLKRSAFLAQAVVVGNGRPHPVALVAPNWELVRKELGLDTVQTEELAKRGDVRKLIEAEATEHTSDLAKFEQIRQVAILPRDLTIEAGELSPTLKVRRRIVESRYADLIDGLYRSPLASPG